MEERGGLWRAVRAASGSSAWSCCWRTARRTPQGVDAQPAGVLTSPFVSTAAGSSRPQVLLSCSLGFGGRGAREGAQGAHWQRAPSSLHPRPARGRPDCRCMHAWTPALTIPARENRLHSSASPAVPPVRAHERVRASRCPARSRRPKQRCQRGRFSQARSPMTPKVPSPGP